MANRNIRRNGDDSQAKSRRKRSANTLSAPCIAFGVLVALSFGFTGFMSGWVPFGNAPINNTDMPPQGWFEAFFGNGAGQQWGIADVLDEVFQPGCYDCEGADRELGAVRLGQAGPSRPADDWTKVIAVVSDCRNRARRAIARATWVAEARALGFDVVFAVGTHPDCDRLETGDPDGDDPEPTGQVKGQTGPATGKPPAHEQPTPRLSEIDAERRHAGGDLLDLGVPERYENLPRKTMALLRWAADRSPPVDLLLKADDDVFVDAGRLLQRLRGLREDDARKGAGLYLGYFHNDSRPDPAPGSKWSDPLYEQVVGPGAPYMPYAAGPFYGITQPAIALLGGSGSGTFRTDWKNEDVSMGQWLHGTAVQRRHEEGVLRYLEGSTRDRGRVPFALHMQSYQDALPDGAGREEGRSAGRRGGSSAVRAVRGLHGDVPHLQPGSSAAGGSLSYRSQQGGLSRWERDEWLAEVADAIAARVREGGLVRGKCCVA